MNPPLLLIVLASRILKARNGQNDPRRWPQIGNYRLHRYAGEVGITDEAALERLRKIVNLLTMPPRKGEKLHD